MKKPVHDEIDSLLDPNLFTGRSAEIVERYLSPNGPVQAKLDKYKDFITSAKTAELHV